MNFWLCCLLPLCVAAGSWQWVWDADASLFRLPEGRDCEWRAGVAGEWEPWQAVCDGALPPEGSALYCEGQVRAFVRWPRQLLPSDCATLRFRAALTRPRWVPSDGVQQLVLYVFLPGLCLTMAAVLVARVRQWSCVSSAYQRVESQQIEMSRRWD